MALYAIKLTNEDKRRAPEADTKYSYGWHRAEILAALVNGVFLLALCFSIFMEAIERFFSTPEISNPKLVVIVGSLGLASNFLGLFLFHEHSHSHDHEHGSKADSHSHGDGEGSSTAASTGSITPTDNEPQRGRSRDRSDSLYGHPIATRARVVQTAQEMQAARSPSLSNGVGPSSMKHERSQSFFSDISGINEEPSATMATEQTPLLNGAKPGRSSSHDSHEHHSTEQNGTETPVPKKSSGHSHGSMNMRALVLHVMGDALGNVGVIATGLIIWLSDLSWKYYFDPIISLVITCIIFSSALPLVKSASFILLQGVPSDISLQEVDEAIRNVDGVRGVHELHIWQLSESKVVASVHVLASRKHDFMKVASEIRKALHDRGIHSSTIQPEYHHSENSTAVAVAPHCLITCPPDQQDCDPAEHACCPPPPATV